MQYFSSNPLVMNILLAHPLLKLMNTRNLRPKYPRGEGGLQPKIGASKIHMLPLFVLLVILTTLAPSRAQTSTPAPVEIVNLEQHLWTTMAEGDFATVRSLFAKDFIQINDHIEAVDALLISLKHCKL